MDVNDIVSKVSHSMIGKADIKLLERNLYIVLSDYEVCETGILWL